MSLREQLHKFTRGPKGHLRFDARQALAASHHGVPLHFAWRIVREARNENLPKPLAFALIEQESEFQNIFGCDWGSGVAFCHEKVTKAKVLTLLRGARPNGVGLTQLTSFNFVISANQMGGAWKPKYQCRVAFRLLHGLIQRHGKRVGLGAYNGGEANPQLAYADEVLARERKWKQILG